MATYMVKNGELPPLTENQKLEIAKLIARGDGNVDVGDMPELTEDFWDNAELGKFYRPRKQQITVKLDADIVAWLKSGGKGYQTRLNKFLRQAMISTSTVEQKKCL